MTRTVCSRATMLIATTMLCLLIAMASARATTPLADLLSDNAVTADDLGRNAAKGLPDNLNSAISQANTVAGNSVTGTIINAGSINNNVGLTTILQNTGNNSLFQTSTVVNVTMH